MSVTTASQHNILATTSLPIQHAADNLQDAKIEHAPLIIEVMQRRCTSIVSSGDFEFKVRVITAWLLDVGITNI